MLDLKQQAARLSATAKAPVAPIIGVSATEPPSSSLPQQEPSTSSGEPLGRPPTDPQIVVNSGGSSSSASGQGVFPLWMAEGFNPWAVPDPWAKHLQAIAEEPDPWVEAAIKPSPSWMTEGSDPWAVAPRTVHVHEAIAHHSGPQEEPDPWAEAARAIQVTPSAQAATTPSEAYAQGPASLRVIRCISCGFRLGLDSRTLHLRCDACRLWNGTSVTSRRHSNTSSGQLHAEEVVRYIASTASQQGLQVDDESSFN